mgnify:CR=1 FL=1
MFYRGAPEREPPSFFRESLGFSASLAVLFDFLLFPSGSLWIQSLGFSGFSGYPESAFLSAVPLGSGFTVLRDGKIRILNIATAPISSLSPIAVATQYHGVAQPGSRDEG